MKAMPLPLTRDLVLIGGGHAHALVARMWGMTPLPGTRVTLINPGPTAPYSGMLPGHIAGHYSRDALDIDLVKLARFAGARLILGAVTAIDPVAKRITIAGRGEIGYDVASLDVGIHTEMPDLPGFAEHGTGAKPLDTYTRRWADFLARATTGAVAPEVAVIGAGVAGVELALAMAHALRRDVGPSARVAILEAGPEVAGKNPETTRRLRAALEGLGVSIHTGARVARLTGEQVVLATGEAVPSRFTVATAGARAHGWLADSPLPLTEDGFVRVDSALRVEGSWDLFAVGDCAHMSHAPRPKAGVYAVRSAPVLFDNLRAALSGGAPRPYHPQKDYLKLISLGGQSALAEKWGRTVSGPALWRWKNRIDTRFMAMFQALPDMAAAPLPKHLTEGVRAELGGAGQPLCAGCGAKVGPGTLSAALAALPRLGRGDVLSGPGDDAAVLDLGQGRQQVLTTDHLRAFTDDPALLARIAAVHALGDIWAMGARPQAALVSVTLPRLSEALQARSLEEIMAAAAEVLTAAGAEIVGGHSTMGAEMSLGFSLTGLVGGPDGGRAITNAGAQAGDALILTRAIGSGTLLAAEMRGKAQGEDVAALWAAMSRPQGDAAQILAPHAHAMTDVTGFGLAGHLLAICRASGVAAEIALADVPLYAGALALAEAGHRSTIYPANKAAAPVTGAEGARAALLHDPQTAGGLLAAVPAAEARALVAALHAAGHGDAAVIGRLHDGAPGLRAV